MDSYSSDIRNPDTFLSTQYLNTVPKRTAALPDVHRSKMRSVRIWIADTVDDSSDFPYQIFPSASTFQDLTQGHHLVLKLYFPSRESFRRRL
jgi:hypothetical protein